METLTLDSTPPSANETAWRDIAIYADGSGIAGEQHDLNLDYLKEAMAKQKLMHLFVVKHAAILAGAYWRTGYIDPLIKICHHIYRGKESTPKTIAKLWPVAKWRRAKAEHASSPSYHWEATIDGCTVRIELAEVYEPSPLPKNSEQIKL